MTSWSLSSLRLFQLNSNAPVSHVRFKKLLHMKQRVNSQKINDNISKIKLRLTFRVLTKDWESLTNINLSSSPEVCEQVFSSESVHTGSGFKSAIKQVWVHLKEGCGADFITENKQHFRKWVGVSDESANASRRLILVALAWRYGRHHQINNLHSGPVRRFSHGLIKHLHIDAQLSIVAGDNLYHQYAL